MGNSDSLKTDIFKQQVEELMDANGWKGQLLLEWNESNQVLRIRLSQDHLTAPGEIVNDYQENLHSLEQIQQECLRALRTGSSGL